MLKMIAAFGSAVALVCAASAVQAQELITNGSFEAGTTGWTPVAGPNCSITPRASGGTVPTPNPGAPDDGAFYVNIGPSGGNQTCTLYQDVAIPAGATANLSLAAAGGFGSSATTAAYTAFARVETTGGALLESVFLEDGTAPGTGAFNTYTADLSAYAGQTVRIVFGFSNGPSCCNEVYGDSVSLIAAPAVATVPTMSEWAMILFGLLLAGGAALHIQRNRRAA